MLEVGLGIDRCGWSWGGFFFFFAGSAATTISTRVCNRHEAGNFAASSSRGKLRGWKKGRVSRFRSYDYPAGIPRHFSSFLSPFLPHRVPSFFRRRKSVHPFLLAAAPLKEIKFTSVGEVTRTFSLSLGSPRSLRGKRFRWKTWLNDKGQCSNVRPPVYWRNFGKLFFLFFFFCFLFPFEHLELSRAAPLVI